MVVTMCDECHCMCVGGLTADTAPDCPGVYMGFHTMAKNTKMTVTTPATRRAIAAPATRRAVAAPAVVAPPVVAVATDTEIARLRAMKLSGSVGYIHDKLTLAKRNIARRWWRNITADANGVSIEHVYRGRWASHPVPVELCAAMGVTAHPVPRA
jgi:hypothetical protein